MWLRLCIFFLLSPVVLAGESDTYNRVTIAVSASAEIINDKLTVNFLARADEDSAAEAAKKVNTAMQNALEKLKKYPEMQARTLNYRSFPIYQEGNVTSWRVEQGLRLEAGKIAELAALAGELQSILTVTEMKYKTSPEKRSKKENQLIEDAIAAFEERATIVSNSLGAQKYRIVTMNIDTQGRFQDVPRREMMATRVQDNEPAMSPGVQAGTQVIMVTASGEIELVESQK